MNHPLNIMQIVLSLEYGGLERLVIDLAETCNKIGCKTTICCLDKFGKLASHAKDRGIEVVLVGKKHGTDIILPFRLAHILRQNKIDVVHTHNMGPLFYGTLAARMARVPVVINTRHGRAKKQKHPIIWHMNNAVVTISEDAKTELLKFNGVNPGKVKVIYNGIDIRRYSKQRENNTVKMALNIEPSTQIIGTVARLAAEKDQFTLLDTFSKVAGKIDNTKLIIVGDGPLRKELTDYANGLGISDKVLFLGFRENIPDIINIFDVFVLSSLMEGVSLTLLEAMASELPIVATNVGGNPEVVIDGVTGFLVPPKEPEKTAEAIAKILQNPELAQKMGGAGRKRVEEKFSLERMVREYGELYEECLARKGIGNI